MPYKQDVTGSSPVIPITKNHMEPCDFFMSFFILPTSIIFAFYTVITGTEIELVGENTIKVGENQKSLPLNHKVWMVYLHKQICGRYRQAECQYLFCKIENP